MSNSRLTPASLSFANGVPYAETFGDVYHSADGGLAQAMHVFLGGNHLPQRWRGRQRFAILETGFGLGLNFLATWLTWREDPERAQQLHYVAIEKHPFTAEDLVQLHASWPALDGLSAALRAAWPPLTPGFHRLLLDEGQVSLTLVFGDIADGLPQIDMAADAFYLDGFAPSKNPGMWAPDMLARLNRLAAPQATLATYTVSAAVRKPLAQAGFVCEKKPGFGRKRDMLTARFAPRWPLPARELGGVGTVFCAHAVDVPTAAWAVPAHPTKFMDSIGEGIGQLASHSMTHEDRRAIVVGAGLAGCAACERLAARGWQVILIERHDMPAQEASGNLAGIAMPLLSKDDNRTARLTRAAYLFTLRWWQQLGGIGRAFAGEACGVLQLARDAAHAQMQREIVDIFNYPKDLVRWLDAEAVAQCTGNAASHGGWLFPKGGWVKPSSLCDAMLAACGDRLQRRFSRSAIMLDRLDNTWSARDASGSTIAQAPVLIIANGTNAGTFLQTQDLPLTAIRGQVTHLPASVLPELPVALCGEGYFARAGEGMCCIGASYEADCDPALRRDSHEGNLRRLAQLLPQLALAEYVLPEGMPQGRVGFRCVSPDRLPLVGALPDSAAAINGSRLRDVPRLPGLYGLLGYGSRGLIWAPFAAELLASMLENEPLPIEHELAAALDPARFALKAHRRGGNPA